MAEDRKAPTFEESVSELKLVISKNPASISGQYMTRCLEDAVRAHRTEVETAHEFRHRAEDLCRKQGRILDELTPHDSHGDPVTCDSFIDLHGEVFPVGGVDNRNGVFYLDEQGQWQFADASFCRRVDIFLPDDPKAALSLHALAHEIKRTWEDPDSIGNGEGMDALLDRLIKMADASFIQAGADE